MEVDTVAVAVVDQLGRLIGKRLTLEAWEGVRAAGTLAMPDFHLITDAANHPVAGLAASGVESGFRNGALVPDLGTWRLLAWDEGTALVISDPVTADGEPAAESPRWVLRRQVERLAAHGLSAGCATELEFYAFRTTYEAAAATGYRRLRPGYHRAGDNDLLVDGHLEPFLGEVRRLLPQAGVPIELTQGEGGRGQLEVSLRWCDPLAMADRHVVYKHGVKALAQRHGLAATFMAKPATDDSGSSCHVHLSLRDAGGGNALGTRDEVTPAGRAFLAGLLAHAADLCLLFAPHANSYRRLLPGSWAPASATWGVDNRTVLVRLCGAPDDPRFEFRLPGADCNPYLAIAGVLAAGLAGLEADLRPPAPVVGDGYRADAPPLPRDLAEAIERFERSAVAERALGAAVQAHLARLARHELEIDRREVTDVDRRRLFEVA